MKDQIKIIGIIISIGLMGGAGYALVLYFISKI